MTAGFSYAKAVKSTLNLLWNGSDGTQTPVTPLKAYDGSEPAENATFLYGTFPDQNPAYTANSSVIAARALWHFAQLWFTEFPEHHTYDNRLSLAGNSYGGFWVSTSMGKSRSVASSITELRHCLWLVQRTFSVKTKRSNVGHLKAPAYIWTLPSSQMVKLTHSTK